VRGKIISIEERVVNIGGEERKVFSGIMADETGKVRFTAWHDFGLKEGDAIRIKGGYVRKWRGAPQLIFDENSEVEKIDEEIVVQETIVPLYKIVEAGGGIDLCMQGVILDVRKDSGIIFRCPKCNRRIRNGVCEEDGEVEGTPDLRIRALLDDGTGAVDAIFNRQISEKLLGKSMEEYLSIAKEAMDYSIVYEEIFDKLVAKPVKVKGDSMPSDFIVTIFAKDAEIVKIDEKKEAEELLTQLEG
jgi:replication factor A1